ncbi:MAG TPA: energy transducer TonB [Candidatus Polarisedimenticolaceae bacterium]|nr:energy transducer TonB [Candidatus Polarisedimenticolaceae bacterium]
MRQGSARRSISLLQGAGAFCLAVGATLALFLVLPLMQSIYDPIPDDLLSVTEVGVELPPPPPPLPEEETEEEEPPDEPPKLNEPAQPLDLAQLDLALNPGLGDGVFGDFTVELFDRMAQGGDEELDRVFSLGELDQRPRVIFQRMPQYPPELRRSKRQGTVYVVFVVDTDGRVTSPTIETASDGAFERPALEAVRQWRFEPGTRKGEKVQFKMRVPITFNAG